MTARILNRKLRRDLGRRRAQVIAVALTVFVGLVVAVLTAGLSSNLSRSYDETYERTAFADVWIAGGSDDLAATIAGIDGVAAVERRTSADVSATFDDRPIRTRLVGFGPDTTLNRLVVSEGADIEPTGSGVVLEQHAADHFGLGPGDEITIGGIGLVEIVGVAVSPEWLWIAPTRQEVIVDPSEFAVVFAPEDLAARAAPSSSTQLVVAVEPERAADYDETVARVDEAALAAGAGEVLTRETQPANRALQDDLKSFEQLSIMFPALFLAAAGLATAVLLSRLVTQQRAEIGMLRANGFRTATIQRHYAAYGVVVALLGAIPAIPVGAVAGRLATQAYTDLLGVPFSATAIRPLPWLLVVVFAALVGAAAGAFAARRATSVDPAAAMRPGGGTVAGKRSPFERLLPARAPNWARVAVRNLGRAPGRAATTAVGIILALVLTMTGLVLNDTINDLFTTQFTKTDLRGLVVEVGDRGEIDATIAELSAIDGVSAVEPHVELGASLLSGEGVVTERLQIYAAGTELHDFTPVGGLPADGLVLSTNAADALGVGSGDEIEVRALDGTSGRLAVAALISEPFAGSSYLSASAWEGIGGPTPASVAVGLVDRDAHEQVRAEVAAVAGVTRVSDQVATAELAEELLAASRFFVGVVLLLAVVMAIALIFNALAVTIGERETEVATLQANGVGRSWIRRAITVENLVTVALGLIPGLIIGRITAGAFISQFSTDQFRFDPVLRPTSLIATAILLAACALIAQVPGLRRLDRLDLPAKVRERAL